MDVVDDVVVKDKVETHIANIIASKVQCIIIIW